MNFIFLAFPTTTEKYEIYTDVYDTFSGGNSGYSGDVASGDYSSSGYSGNVVSGDYSSSGYSENVASGDYSSSGYSGNVVSGDYRSGGYNGTDVTKDYSSGSSAEYWNGSGSSAQYEESYEYLSPNNDYSNYFASRNPDSYDSSGTIVVVPVNSNDIADGSAN